MTSLQLPDMDQTHWTARALLSSSMALGIICVVSATSLQGQTAALNDAMSVRLWLSNCNEKPHRANINSVYDVFPLESSVSALQAVQAPKFFLRMAVGFFIVGFGLYLLFSWLNDSASTSADHRDIFVVFVCVVGGAVSHNLILILLRGSDMKTCEEQFDLRPKEDHRLPERLKSLEEKLRRLRRIPKATRTDHEETEQGISEAVFAADALRSQIGGASQDGGYLV